MRGRGGEGATRGWKWDLERGGGGRGNRACAPLKLKSSTCQGVAGFEVKPHRIPPHNTTRSSRDPGDTMVVLWGRNGA